jgi:chaperonin GroES
VIIYKDYSGTEIDLDGEKFLVVPYEDILAKIVETEEI